MNGWINELLDKLADELEQPSLQLYLFSISSVVFENYLLNV